MIQIINKIGGSMTVKILNMIKTIAVIYVITAIILLGLSFGLYKFNLSEWQSGDNNYVYNFVCSWWLYDWLETKK